jgi:AraC-like DNA-binding protein
VSPKTVLGDLQRELESQTGIRTLIGIGTPESAHSPEGMHLSYLQAARTAEFLRIRKRERLLAFDELEAPRHGTVSYFAELLQSLELAIWKNDVQGVEAVMERILDYIGSDGMPPHLVRTVYLNTAGVILNGLQRFRHDDCHLLRLADAMFQHRYTFGQMVAILRESCGKLCDMIRASLPPARPASKSEMAAYIERHGLDPNFSLQQIADHFGLSPSNFSHHFKKTMGQNFKEYVDRLRIQQSVRLLRHTDDTLDAIARQVGYTSTSSFIRAFKKSVGITPGQFRDAGGRTF